MSKDKVLRSEAPRLHVVRRPFLSVADFRVSPLTTTAGMARVIRLGDALTNYSSVSLDLALIRKISADEAFIRGEVCKEGTLPERESVIRSLANPRGTNEYCDELDERADEDAPRCLPGRPLNIATRWSNVEQAASGSAQPGQAEYPRAAAQGHRIPVAASRSAPVLLGRRPVADAVDTNPARQNDGFAARRCGKAGPGNVSFPLRSQE